MINTSSYSVTNTITVGSQPSSVALGADGRLYVANTGSGTVSVINTVTNTLVDTDPNALGTEFHFRGTLAQLGRVQPQWQPGLCRQRQRHRFGDRHPAPTPWSAPATIDSDTTGGHVIAVSLAGTVYVTDAADRTVRVLAV